MELKSANPKKPGQIRSGFYLYLMEFGKIVIRYEI